MRVRELLPGITTADAVKIFRRLGVNPGQMTAQDLRAARNRLAKQYHSDVIGNDELMQHINAAYDLLKPLVPPEPQQPAPEPQQPAAEPEKPPVEDTVRDQIETLRANIQSQAQAKQQRKFWQFWR